MMKIQGDNMGEYVSPVRTYEEIIENHTFSVKDINFMKHALGIDRTSIRNGECVCYRNYYNIGNNDVDKRVWEHLCFVGFANEMTFENYRVTQDGIRFLEDILSTKIVLY